MKYALIAGTAALFLTGCAPAVYVLPTNDNYKPSHQFIDARADWQKTMNLGSLSVTACDYASKRYGDAETSPSRIDYLASRLSPVLEKKSMRGAVKVLTFTIHDNAQAQQRRQITAAAIQAVAVSRAKDPARAMAETQNLVGENKAFACKLDQEGGGYTEEENPTYQPVAIVNIVVEIDGVTYAARRVEPANGDGPTVILRAVTKAVDELVQKVANG